MFKETKTEGNEAKKPGPTKEKEREAGTPPEKSKKSRMGRETKIGLAVILVLLTILGTVVTRRLTRKADPEVVASTETESAKPASSDSTGNDAATQALSGGHPTVLSPATTSSHASKRPPDDLGQWTSLPGNDHKKGHTPHYSAAPPPRVSFMPDPVVAGDSRNRPADAAPPPLPASLPPLPAPSTGLGLPSAPLAAGPLDTPATLPALPAKQAEPAAPSQVTVPVRTVASDQPPVMTGGPLRAVPSDSGRFSTDSGRFAADSSRSVNESPRWGASGGLRSTPPAMADSTRYGELPPSRPPASLPSRVYEVPRRDDGNYEVQPNDTFWTISEKLYGTGAYFRALAEHNRGKVAVPDRLQVGTLIAAPKMAQLEQTYPALCPKASHRDAARSRTSMASTRSAYGTGRTYVVQEGDTLFDIARNELGKASRWNEIYELNRDALGRDFNYLTPGLQLSLPMKDAQQPADKLTRRPEEAYR